MTERLAGDEAASAANGRTKAEVERPADRAETAFTRRARYCTPYDYFAESLPSVPHHVFTKERDDAFDMAAPTGVVPLDLSGRLATDYPATIPLLLAAYLRVRAGETLSTRFRASCEAYYVITGNGHSRNDEATIEWRVGDFFYLSGGRQTNHVAGADDSVLYVVTNEPQLAYLGAEPSNPGDGPVEAVHYPAEAIAAGLEAARAKLDDDAPGQAVCFSTAAELEGHKLMPTIAAAFNTLEPGNVQRPHRHNAAALTLALDCDGCYSTISGERIDWQRHAVMVTPPAEFHAHYNEGPRLMKSIVVQDHGSHSYARTMGFAFAEEAAQARDIA